jgi:hypothetical protein
VWTVFFWFRIGKMVGSCGKSNKPSGFISGAEFLDYLNVQPTCQEGLCSMQLIGFM